MDLKQIKKRHRRGFIISMGLYMIGMIGVTLLKKYMDIPNYAIYVLATVPILALLYGMAEHWRFVKSLDEYLRARQIKALMVGLALMLSVSASWGILEAIADVASLPSLWFVVIFCLGYGVTEAYLNNKDKTND